MSLDLIWPIRHLLALHVTYRKLSPALFTKYRFPFPSSLMTSPVHSYTSPGTNTSLIRLTSSGMFSVIPWNFLKVPILKSWLSSNVQKSAPRTQFFTNYHTNSQSDPFALLSSQANLVYGRNGLAGTILSSSWPAVPCCTTHRVLFPGLSSELRSHLTLTTEQGLSQFLSLFWCSYRSFKDLYSQYCRDKMIDILPTSYSNG